MKHKSIKKIVSLVSILAISVSLVACGKPKPVELPKDPKQKVEDKSMNEKLQKEKIVNGSKVYISGNTIVGAVIMKKDVPEKEAKKQAQDLANKYAKELKSEYKNLQEEYKGMKINVQVVQNGKNLANVLIEK
ncbi:hypothetical protein [Clostridium botulinum]|uniref:Lipoprotein n=1 Tax=Clostridium botulinum TaxID=1491 RepID=A0A9Q1V095_CLOBO|nr:hypothetical protein [Clostridium botulinum]AEB75403.1 lipoprotein, putative [Clostridium botulinum BKT015925]KEH99040.1 hypothetical protein Z953_12010 [Clostridium botulinum D str. 16868]KEI03760.1 hypothetical protein Y848_04360 [Clostridium botulinum C/D str. Sp77]KLU76367.1 hypothetical protein CBC3_03965 [Clostridium botulinum V891]KOA73629.1 hypothetical protein ADU78_11955 [Clostridium botulinum]